MGPKGPRGPFAAQGPKGALCFGAPLGAISGPSEGSGRAPRAREGPEGPQEGLRMASRGPTPSRGGPKGPERPPLNPQCPMRTAREPKKGPRGHQRGSKKLPEVYSQCWHRCFAVC